MNDSSAHMERSRTSFGRRLRKRIGHLGRLDDLLRDALGRVVSARELMEEGDDRLAELVLYELECDLAGIVAYLDEHELAA